MQFNSEITYSRENHTFWFLPIIMIAPVAGGIVVPGVREESSNTARDFPHKGRR